MDGARRGQRRDPSRQRERMQHAAGGRQLDVGRNAAGQGGKVDHHAARLEPGQLGCAEHGRRHGVEHQVKAVQMPGQTAGVERG